MLLVAPLCCCVDNEPHQMRIIKRINICTHKSQRGEKRNYGDEGCLKLCGASQENINQHNLKNNIINFFQDSNKICYPCLVVELLEDK